MILKCQSFKKQKVHKISVGNILTELDERQCSERWNLEKKYSCVTLDSGTEGKERTSCPKCLFGPITVAVRFNLRGLKG